MPVPLRTNANLRVEAKFNVVTEFPNFDLHAAAAAGNIGLVEYALSRGQPVNSVLDGVLPLHAACAGGDEQVVKLLIEHGADVNAPRLPRKYSTGGSRDVSAPIVGTSGSTPLHFAAANGNKNIILTLLLRGAHPDRADKHGVTPEMLARRNKWIECADLLHNWVDKRDRDLRERQGPYDEPSPGTEAEFSGRRRVQVKRSIDTALNMLKASSSGLSDAYLRPPASSSSSSNFPSQTPPASPNRSEYPLIGTPSDDGRFTPSPIDLASRRPSLPHVFSPPPPVAGTRSHKPATLTKPTPSNPRRPRSAGTGAEQDDNYHPPYGRGGAGRLGSKYSLMNIFKKAGENESMTSHHTSSSLSISTSPSQDNSSAFESDSTSYRTPGRFRMGSDTSRRTRSPSTSQTASLPSHAKTPSMSQDYSPSHPPMPLAVDLHNAMAQQQHMTRDRSGSSSSRFDVANGLDDSVSYGSPSSVSSSPLTKYGLLRGKGPSGHSRDRSGSGASINAFSANRNAATYDEDSGDSSARTKSSRPGIRRGHHRSTSFGQGQPNSRRPSAGSSDRIPDSAPPTVPDFGPHADIMEEEDEYGRPLDRAELPMLSTDVDDTTTTSEFPFSLTEPPLSVDDASSPVTVKLQVPSPIDYRGRGDSISSNSTTDSLFTRPHRNVAETTNADSETATTPVLSGAESSFQSSPKPASDRSQGDGPQVESMPENLNMTGSPRRAVTALGIDIRLIESHAEAEALVQRAQQDILDLAHPGHVNQPPSGDGWTPLSARLAAYGETLALEKKLRQQKEENERGTDDTFPSPTAATSMSQSPHRKNGVNRQYSLEHRSPTSGQRLKAPRRPHTSNGTESTHDAPVEGSTSPVQANSASSLIAFRSAPVEPQQRPHPGYRHVMRARTPDPDERSSRVNSLDGIDTDSDFGVPLTRVSTAPMLSPLKSKREQTRSATKLTRMGFPNDVNGRVPPTVSPSASNKRFGSGLKSFMQSFKNKA